MLPLLRGATLVAIHVTKAGTTASLRALCGVPDCIEAATRKYSLRPVRILGPCVMKNDAALFSLCENSAETPRINKSNLANEDYPSSSNYNPDCIVSSHDCAPKYEKILFLYVCLINFYTVNNK